MAPRFDGSDDDEAIKFEDGGINNTQDDSVQLYRTNS